MADVGAKASVDLGRYGCWIEITDENGGRTEKCGVVVEGNCEENDHAPMFVAASLNDLIRGGRSKNRAPVECVDTRAVKFSYDTREILEIAPTSNFNDKLFVMLRSVTLPKDAIDQLEQRLKGNRNTWKIWVLIREAGYLEVYDPQTKMRYTKKYPEVRNLEPTLKALGRLIDQIEIDRTQVRTAGRRQ